jgi:uncharacterized protein (TIGR03435 family)
LELLAVGIFGGTSLGDRIEVLLTRGREFSARVSPWRVGATAIMLLMLVATGSFAPRWIALAQPPSFDVASIRPVVSEARGETFQPLSGGRLRVKNNPVSNLIQNAYGIRNYQILGGPDWLNSDRFDMEAKAEGNSGRPQVMLMLQTLLADRFKLKFHRETRDLPVFTLTVAKGGLKMQPWKEGSCITVDPGKPTAPPALGREESPYCGDDHLLANEQNMEWTATKTDMAGVSRALSVVMGHTVIDKTGVTGTFDVHLEWTRDEASGGPPGDPDKPASTVDGARTSIFTVLQERLGLQLKSDKGPVEVFVIDHLEKPDAN